MNHTDLLAAGLNVFPCTPKKGPAVPKGHDWHNPIPYAWAPSHLIGIDIPSSIVVIDMDSYKGGGRIACGRRGPDGRQARVGPGPNPDHTERR